MKRLYRVEGKFPTPQRTLEYCSGEGPLTVLKLPMTVFEGTIKELKAAFPITEFPKPISHSVLDVGRGASSESVFLKLFEKYSYEQTWSESSEDPRLSAS